MPKCHTDNNRINIDISITNNKLISLTLNNPFITAHARGEEISPFLFCALRRVDMEEKNEYGESLGEVRVEMLCRCRAVMIPKVRSRLQQQRRPPGTHECDNLICIPNYCVLCTKILSVANIFLECNCTYKRKRL